VPVLATQALAWLVSGRSAAGLRAQAERLSEFVAARPDADLVDVGWSLATTRSAFEHRAVVTGAGRAELAAGLAAVAAGEPAAGVITGAVSANRADRVVFVFPGQGSQWAGMGRGLAAVSPVFAARLAECGQALASYVDWSVEDVLGGAEGAPALEAAEVVQPVLWAVMVSLAALWQAAGVTPDAVVGHSQGEIAAATVAGVLSLDDAARVVVLRGRALAVLAGRGGMLSVAEAAGRVRDRLVPFGDRLAVAAVNGPSATVVSGDTAALAELAAACEAAGVRTRLVPVDYASHCAQVDGVREEILAALAGIAPAAGRVPVMSAMTGELLGGAGAGAGYWYDSLRSAVEFEGAVRALAGSGHKVFIEVSPHPVLAAAVSETLEEALAGSGVPVVTGTLRRGEDEPGRFLASLAGVHVRGVEVDWRAVLAAGRRVGLPTYAFEHQRYWPRANPAAAIADVTSAGLGAVAHPLLGAAVELAAGGGLVMTGRVSLGGQPWLADHAVNGTVLFPGTGYVELAVRAGDQVGCGRVEELTLAAPLVLAGRDAVQVQVTVGGPGEGGQRAVEVYARPGEAAGDVPWTRHAAGLLAPSGDPGAGVAAEFAAWPPEGAVPLAVEGFYEGLAAAGYEYGPSFRGLRAAWQRGDDIFAEVGLPGEAAAEAASFGLHPALLDAAMHAAGLAADADRGARMPFAWTGVSLYAAGASVLWVRLRRDAGGGLSLAAADTSGVPVVVVDRLVSRPVAGGELAAAGGAGGALFGVEWVPVPVSAVAGGAWAVAGGDRLGLAAGLAGSGVSVREFADLAALAGAVASGEPVPPVVLACAGAADGADAADLARAETGRVLGLVQGWLAAGELAGSRLVLVMRGAVAAGAGEGVEDLAGAAAWGLVRSAQSEEPGRLVLADLPPVPGAGEGALLAAGLAAGEPELAVRGQAVLARRLARPAGGPGVPGDGGPGPQAAARVPGTVLVTGGTGTLAGVTAAHLARTGRARALILASRSGPAAAGAAVLAAEIAAAGAAVQVICCDVTDRAAVAAVLAQVPAGCPLTGVVHTAGIVDDALTGSLTPARLAAVMRPKADAAWHLHQLTRDLDLDMFVLFSSAAAVFGGAGQGSYVAANAFLDALAARRRARGLPALSLAWGTWLAREGIGRNLTRGQLARFNRGGMAELTAAEGLALLDLALGRDEALLIPARLDIAAARAQAARGTVLPPLWHGLAGPPARRAAATPGLAQGPAPLLAQLAAQPPAAQARLLLTLVRTHAAAVLGHPAPEAIDPHRAFTDIGFDSMTAVELRNHLNTATGLRLPATMIFDYPTPATLATHLLTELTGQIAGMSDAGSAAVPSVLAELDKLEMAMSAESPDELTRMKVAVRLQTLLSRWNDPRELAAESAESPLLDSASDEEMIEFINKELGR
jgi:acyl transferase domain-containing protein